MSYNYRLCVKVMIYMMSRGIPGRETKDRMVHVDGRHYYLCDLYIGNTDISENGYRKFTVNTILK